MAVNHWLRGSAILLALSIIIAGAVTASIKSVHTSVSSEIAAGEAAITDTSNVNPKFDPKAALGVEVQEKLKHAGPDAVIARNSSTGVTIVTDRKPVRSVNIFGTEPSTPSSSDAVEEGSNIFTPNLVIGTDNRSQITNVNAYPYRAVVFLEITYASGAKGTASGAFVSNTAILTAGHVVYSQKHGWATSIKVIPGGTRSSNKTATTSDVLSVNAWVNNANWEYDYGMIRVPASLGTGYFGTSAKSDANLTGKSVYNYGYPADKKYGTLWYDSGTVGTAMARRFPHNTDTSSGSSGGPISLNTDYTYIVGIHSDSYNSSYNIATRVTADVVDFIQTNTSW
ncbi:trypsin-like serine peptidase [Paenibacillus gorillae]|uniref:trypsin-like serine peptidase n=1 Tax=Paenibacillus gorillae TaxID=1243662 RepID=UPI0004B4CE88|nr:trypsin-like serine protease [Paenibacillus gorillae]